MDDHRGLLVPGRTVVTFEVTDDHLGVDEYDVVTRRPISHHARPGRRFARSHHRSAWPAEYDLMARHAGLAGLEPHARWADWHRRPFMADSSSQVSVRRKPER